MKIVYISRSILPSRTANSVHVMKMCNAFAKLGHEVILLAPWTKKLEEKNINDIFEYYGVEKNFELRKLYSPNIKYLKKRIYSLRCLKIIKDEKPDIVYGRNDIFAFYLAQKLGFFTLFEEHDPIQEKSFESFFFEKYMNNNKNSIKLITNSDALKKMYHDRWKISLDHIYVAGNGTNPIPNNLIPQNIHVDSNKTHIGYVGSLFQGRGIDIIIELSKRLPSAVFHIIGGKDKDLEFWKNQVQNDNIIFYGFVAPKDTYKYRNMCDILLAPYQSDEEGNRSSKYMSPIKLFEYMSSRKAIICSNFKVVYEALNNECAILVDSKNIDEWEESINDLIQDKEKRDLLANNAYQKFLTYHTWEARAAKIINFINENRL